MFSADPVKIRIIQTAGRPTSRDEVCSLIQAASYNAKLTSAPLRELLVKGPKFKWDKRRDEAYSHLMNIMSSIIQIPIPGFGGTLN